MASDRVHGLGMTVVMVKVKAKVRARIKAGL